MIVLEKFTLERKNEPLLFDLYLSSSQLLSGGVITGTIRTINRRVLLLVICN